MRVSSDAIPLKQTISFPDTFISPYFSSSGVGTKMPVASEDCLNWYQYSDNNYGTSNGRAIVQSRSQGPFYGTWK